MGEMTPCGRYDLFKKNYPDFEGTVSEALDLPLPVFEDKMWLVKRTFSRDQLRLLCYDIVLSLPLNKRTEYTLGVYILEIETLYLSEPSEDNRRELADKLTNIYERVIALDSQGIDNPMKFACYVKEKKIEIVKLAQVISEQE